MSKIIAVCGTPNSGKTTFSFKLAQTICRKSNDQPTIYLSPDPRIPSVGFLFPRENSDNLESMGKILERTEIAREDIISHFTFFNSMKNLAILGYKTGENSYSYPRANKEKLDVFFTLMKQIAEYIIIDVSNYSEDYISSYAKNICDKAVMMLRPDIKSIMYCQSCFNEFLMIEDKKINLMNVMDNDVHLPVNECLGYFGEPPVVLPYSQMLKQSGINGSQTSMIFLDGKYNAVVKKVACEVM